MLKQKEELERMMAQKLMQAQQAVSTNTSMPAVFE